MSASDVFERGPGQWRALLELFGCPPEVDASAAADQVRIARLCAGVALLLGRPWIPVPTLTRREEDVDAAELPDGPPPVLANLRPVGDVDLGEVELRVEGLFCADENPGGAL